MESRSLQRNPFRCANGTLCMSGILLILLISLFFPLPSALGQAADPQPASSLPDAPEPQKAAKAAAPKAQPCRSKLAASGAATLQPPAVAGKAARTPPPCSWSQQGINWFARFINGPEVKPLTPAEKARLAMRNVLDPFNGLTILGEAGISVASDAHSPYGPGMSGYGRYVGVSFTQDITGEFFGTFLIPSLAHQDPHYHRMPNASIPRRFLHAVKQVVWTRGDNGQNMVNYANLVGFAIDDEISNLYVPGRQTDLPASATRYSIGLATAPIDNFITEFLPDVARHVHVRIVLIQRVINQVAKTDYQSQ